VCKTAIGDYTLEKPPDMIRPAWYHETLTKKDFTKRGQTVFSKKLGHAAVDLPRWKGLGRDWNLPQARVPVKGELGLVI